MTANRNGLPEIARKAESLAVAIENAVRSFSRHNKYAIGANLRTAVMLVVQVCNRAWRDRSRQIHWVNELVWVIDELKVVIQLAKQLHAFKSFNQFELIIRAADDLGRCAGGWKRALHDKGQNSAVPQQERAQILSDRSASHVGLNNRQRCATQGDAQ
jgi:hypothetical protein